MVEFIKGPMIIMDATKFYGKFNEGITVREAISDILMECRSKNGKIRIIPLKKEDTILEYEHGIVKNNLEDDNISKSEVLSINATENYLHGMSFYVNIICNEEINNG